MALTPPAPIASATTSACPSAGPGCGLQEGDWSASATSQPPIVAAGDRAAKPTAHRAAAGPGPTGHARDAINVPACRASRARAAPLDSEAMTFRYPAALQDVTAAYRDLAGQAGSTDHVVVSGESVGGNRCRSLHENRGQIPSLTAIVREF